MRENEISYDGKPEKTIDLLGIFGSLFTVQMKRNR